MSIASTPFVRLAIAPVVLAAFATGCAHGQQPTQSASAAAVPVVRAQQGTVFPRSVLSGIITPLQNVGITSSLSEPTDAVYVKEGDRVHRGQLLALLDSADLRAQLAQYQATVSSNQAKAAQTYDQADSPSFRTIIWSTKPAPQYARCSRRSRPTH